MVLLQLKYLVYQLYLLFIQGRNSRARGKVFRVGDMTEDEVMHYLQVRGIKDNDKEHVFDLLGGRMLDLANFTSELIRGVTFNGTSILRRLIFDAKKRCITEVNDILESAQGELIGNGEHEKMRRILKLSLEKSFTINDLHAKSEGERAEFKKIADVLVSKNILSRIGSSYHLHSTLVKSYLTGLL